jgi:hypothetical protein
MWFFLILARPAHFVSSSAGCQFSGFLVAPVSPVSVSCLSPHCSQDRFGFVFLPLSTVRDLSRSRSCFDFFCPHLDPSPPGLSLCSWISCSSPARAEHCPASFLPWFVHSCVACALLFLVRFSFSRAENGGQSSLARTQLVFFGSVAGVTSSTSIFSAFVLPNFVWIVAGWSWYHFWATESKSSRFLVLIALKRLLSEYAYKLFGEMPVRTKNEFWSNFCRRSRTWSCWHWFVFLLWFLSRFRGLITLL